ncbi:hypothetical protein [Bacteroides sp. OF04-15BH]|uniref:hypothetical protein n=1 Tax=Bacteroides sp. OF04-15BH TaxID=2292281 RepID=UPI000E4986C9|nr:hypothetical protein [Bacteroides sp. OF04-15BH]RHP66709.1 hypothetical protein DXA74_02460 [Bacteroides sp. OF04-15BH]
MELNIYSKDGSLKLTVSPSDSSTVTEEVGGECSVSLSFDTFEFRPIEVNDYIEVAGVRYKARSTYRPKMKNRQSYSYSLRFYAPIHDAQQALMKTETDGGLISEFSLWGGPREHLQKWVDNMNRLAGSELWTIGSVITGENKNIDYRNVNCWDAAFGSNGIASTYETEMWADGYVINLCKCERGERVTLGYGNGLTSLTPEDNSDKVRFFTRLFSLGSTRNINVSTYGSSRLQLPSRATFVDHNTDRYGVFEDSEEDAFAGIFPQYIGTVTAVRSESKTDENGKKFTVYYIKDSGMTWEPQALPEQTFMLSFQTGDLQGYGDDTNKSFQAEWHKDTKEWEIINIWLDENTQVPGGNIVPIVGNQYFPWNMIMPQEYITEAEKRYETAVNDFVANYSGEPVAYSGSTDYIHCAKQAMPLRIGQTVRLESDLYFEDGFQNTRITKVVRKLCRLTDATVTFAEQIGTGWKKSVDNQLSSLHYELQRQAEQASIDVIKTTDTKTPSDNNVFSALRSLATFLRKDKADSTSHLLTLLDGAVFGANKAEITAEGVAQVVSLLVGSKAEITAEGKAILQNLLVKVQAEINRLLVTGGAEVQNGLLADLITVQDGLLKTIITPTEIRTATAIATNVQTETINNDGDSAVLHGNKADFKGPVGSKSYVPGLTGFGWNVDAKGNAWFNGINLREFLETPELRYNRVTVITDEQWSAPGGGIIESADTEALILTLKLEEGEAAALEVDDICKGIFHSGTGFSTCFFRITEVLGESTFRYTLRPGYEMHPLTAMHFVAYGNFTNPDRQKSAYTTREYTRYLKDVNDWDITERNIVMMMGNLDGMRLNGMDMSGYSAFLRNIYMTGTIRQISGDGVTETPVPAWKGEWKAGTYYKNDEVTHNGSTWLCISDEPTTQEPSIAATDWLQTVSEGKDAVVVSVYSTNGLFFQNGQGETELYAVVRQGDADITSSLPAGRFSWQRTSRNTEADAIWNKTHQGVGSRIRIIPDDVEGRSNFDCIVTI